MKTINEQNLHPANFVINQNGSDKKIALKFAPNTESAPNAIEMTADGIKVDVSKWVTYIPDRVTRTVNTIGYDRRWFQYNPKSQEGRIKLDFTYLGSGDVCFNIPQNAPTPIDLIEFQGLGGSTMYISKNSRDIKCTGMTKGTRYIFNLSGIFTHEVTP